MPQMKSIVRRSARCLAQATLTSSIVSVGTNTEWQSDAPGVTKNRTMHFLSFFSSSMWCWSCQTLLFVWCILVALTAWIPTCELYACWACDHSLLFHAPPRSALSVAKWSSRPPSPRPSVPAKSKPRPGADDMVWNEDDKDEWQVLLWRHFQGFWYSSTHFVQLYIRYSSMHSKDKCS